MATSPNQDFQSNLRDFAKTVYLALLKLAFIENTIKPTQNFQEIENVRKFSFGLIQAINQGGTTSSTSGIVATVSALNQSAAIGLTTVYTTPNDGVVHVYKISQALQCYTAGTGTGQLAISYNQPNGNLTAITICPGGNWSSTNNVDAHDAVIVCQPNSAIQWETSYMATGSYSAYTIVELLM